jgi:hypothetical protein
MKRLLAILVIASATIAQTPSNPDFSSPSVDPRWGTWGSGATITHDPVEGAGAPGSLHAQFTGSGHAEMGLWLNLPSGLIGGKTLEFRAKAKMKNISPLAAQGDLNVVAIIYWYLAQPGVKDQWQFISVYEAADDEWVDTKSEVKKLILPKTQFSEMKVAFYCFKEQAAASTWDLWMDDVTLLLDGADITHATGLRFSPMNGTAGISAQSAISAGAFSLLGKNLGSRFDGSTKSSNLIIYRAGNSKSIPAALFGTGR